MLSLLCPVYASTLGALGLAQDFPDAARQSQDTSSEAQGKRACASKLYLSVFLHVCAFCDNAHRALQFPEVCSEDQAETEDEGQADETDEGLKFVGRFSHRREISCLEKAAAVSAANEALSRLSCRSGMVGLWAAVISRTC
jgi:hypothetical protein